MKSLRNFTLQQMEKLLNFELFFATFRRVSDFVSTISCWLKLVLSVDVATSRDFTYSALVVQKYINFSITLDFSAIENYFRFTFQSFLVQWKRIKIFNVTLHFSLRHKSNTSALSATPSLDYWIISFTYLSCFVYEAQWLWVTYWKRKKNIINFSVFM